MRYMYDSCAGSFPAKRGRDLTLGYVDGHNCNLRASFDVGISSIGTDAGTVLDVEPGNLDAAKAVGWVQMRRSAGVDPTVYVAQWAAGYSMQDVNAAFDAFGLRRPWIWLAPWPTDVIPDDPQIVAVQFGYVGPYDISAVREFWPGVDGPAEEEDMTPEEHAWLADVHAATDKMKWQISLGTYDGEESYLHQAAVRTEWVLTDVEQLKADMSAVKAKLGL